MIRIWKPRSTPSTISIAADGLWSSMKPANVPRAPRAAADTAVVEAAAMAVAAAEADVKVAVVVATVAAAEAGAKVAAEAVATEEAVAVVDTVVADAAT